MAPALALVGIGRLGEILLNHLGSQSSYLAAYSNLSHQAFLALSYFQRR